MLGIKICGITGLEDALAVAEAGADALGFIFYPKSPRYVSPEKAREIIDGLPGGIAKVGVFVNDDPRHVMGVAETCSLDLIQLHGDESPAYCSRFPASMIIKAMAPRSAEDMQKAADYDVRAILIDTFAPGLYGGTGKVSNWVAARILAQSYSVILSGGLSSENIIDAIESVGPSAVDINSGVELSPGKKDHNKIRSIIEITVRAGFRSGPGGKNIFHDN